MEIFVYIYIEI